MTRKLDKVLTRQRTTRTRDIAIGAFAAVVLVFQVFAFSSATGAADAATDAQIRAPAPSVVDVITHHTEQVCGTVPAADMRC